MLALSPRGDRRRDHFDINAVDCKHETERHRPRQFGERFDVPASAQPEAARRANDHRPGRSEEPGLAISTAWQAHHMFWATAQANTCARQPSSDEPPAPAGIGGRETTGPPPTTALFDLLSPSSAFRAAFHGGGPRPPRVALGLAADLLLGHPLTTRAHRCGETAELDPAPQTSGFDQRDHGNPSDIR
jgi:hypothetical protein